MGLVAQTLLLHLEPLEGHSCTSPTQSPAEASVGCVHVLRATVPLAHSEHIAPAARQAERSLGAESHAKQSTSKGELNESLPTTLSELERGKTRRYVLPSIMRKRIRRQAGQGRRRARKASTIRR